jgi:hypothetical protein
MEKLKKGQRVQHIKRLNWGLGQLLEDENADEIRVFFEESPEGVVRLGAAARDKLRVVTGADAHSTLLDNLDVGGKKRVTLDSAKQRFQKLFIGGFYGKRHLEEERNYKDELTRVAKQLLAKDVLLPLMESGNYQQVCDHAKKLVSHSKNIQPSHFEKMAFNDGLKTLTDAEPFARSFFDFLHGDGELEPRFNRFAQVLEQMDADKWPIITVFRFFLFPATDACIKPEHLKNAAEFCHFELNYKPRLNWLTYHSVTKFYQYLFDNLADSTAELKPRDMIDVQSFIWIIDPESYPGE